MPGRDHSLQIKDERWAVACHQKNYSWKINETQMSQSFVILFCNFCIVVLYPCTYHTVTFWYCCIPTSWQLPTSLLHYGFLCCSCACVTFHTLLERDIYFRGHLVKGHMKRACGLHRPALKLCLPVGQCTKVLLPHITLLPPVLCLPDEAQNTRGREASQHQHRWPVLTLILRCCYRITQSEAWCKRRAHFVLNSHYYK